MKKLSAKLLLLLLSLFLLVFSAIAAPEIYSGTLTAPGSAGSASVTGLSFTPHCMVMYGSAGSAGESNYSLSIGMTAHSSQWARFGFQSSFSGSNTTANGAFTDRLLYLANESATVILRVNFTSFNSDGFTVDFATTTSGMKIGYILFGGDIDCYVGSYSTGTSTGSVNVTDVGLAPNLMFFVPSYYIGFGADDGTNKFAWHLAFPGGSLPTKTISIQTTSYSQYVMNGGGGTPETIHLASAVSAFGSDDFTMNQATAPASAITVYYMALAGSEVAVGTFNTATSTGDADVVTGLSFQPQGGLFTTYGFASSATKQTGFALSFGTHDGDLNQQQLGTSAKGASADTDNRRAFSSSVYRFTNIASPYGEAEGATVTALNPDGETWTYYAADATARQMGYVLFGSAPAAGGNAGRMGLLGVGQ